MSSHANQQAEAKGLSAGEKPLRLALPDCYQRLIDQFSRHHLHSYDVTATAEAEPHGWTIRLSFGEGAGEKRSRTFSSDELTGAAEELVAFYEEAAKACQKRLVSDYYKLMKP
ncbi:MAG: hypothetical protein K0R75_511 [Paenibacillaceae bacterium]|jgi:hypothetical protein|nr:hypothetical protein [Paenibacillaceae bacterium]